VNAPRRLVLSALFACLFVLVLVGVSALLMFASEAGPEGGGRAPEERLVALFAVVAVACATVCAVVYRLYALYVAAPLRLAEELAATSAHSGLRVGEHGASEVRVLGQAANQVLAVRDALERDVAERIREARASLEEERSRLAALMADLSQSVVVCNLDGRVLLYNQRAKQEPESSPWKTTCRTFRLLRRCCQLMLQNFAVTCY